MSSQSAALCVRFTHSAEVITTPISISDPDGIERAARWALRLANGTDPGALLLRNTPEGVYCWTRRKVAAARGVMVLL